MTRIERILPYELPAVIDPTASCFPAASTQPLLLRERVQMGRPPLGQMTGDRW